MQRNKIYKTTKWQNVRAEVLKMDHNECTRCNHTFFESGEPKKITPAYLVHHRYYVDKYPQYKYSIFVNGERNLVSLCNDCHEQLHHRKYNKVEHFSTEERFD